MKQIKTHVLYSVQCYHCHTAQYDKGSIMLWPTKQEALDAALSAGWELYIRNRLYCPQCIANQQHLPPSYRNKQ